MSKRANNEGTIIKRARTINGKSYTYWEAKVMLGHDSRGNIVRKSFSGKTQKEVKEKMLDAISAFQNQEYFEPSKSTLEKWINIWLDEYCGHLKYQAKKSYMAQCNTHIIPALGKIKLSDLTTDKIQTFYNELSKTGHATTKLDKKTKKPITTYSPLSPKSIKNIHSILSKCLNTAIDLGYIKTNPALKTYLPKITRKDISPLTEDQIRDFLSRLEKEEYSTLYKLIIFTGVRKAEALGMTWDSVDLETGIWHVYKQLIKKPKRDGGYTFDSLKNNKSRYLSLPPYIVELLKQRKIEQEREHEEAGEIWCGYTSEKEQKSYLVFTQKDGSPIDPKTAYKHYKKIVAEMGIEESRVHDLRHTYAVVSLMNGDNIKIVQDNLGHSSSSITLDIYGHTTQTMKLQSTAKMQDFISSVTKEKSTKKCP